MQRDLTRLASGDARSGGRGRRDPRRLHRLGRDAPRAPGGAGRARRFRRRHLGQQPADRPRRSALLSPAATCAACANPIRERSALLRIAPTLVEPLPVLVPTDGRRAPTSRAGPRHGPPPQRPALLDRNRGLDAAHRLPTAAGFSTRRVPPAVPGLSRRRTRAAARCGTMRGCGTPSASRSPSCAPRPSRGAAVANYCRCRRGLTDGGRLRSSAVSATDLTTAAGWRSAAGRVVVAAGPWTAGR